MHMGLGRNLIVVGWYYHNAYLKIEQETFFKILLAITNVHQKVRMAVGPFDNGYKTRMDPTRPSRSFREAMHREGAQEWAEALNKEYMGFKQLGGF